MNFSEEIKMLRPSVTKYVEKLYVTNLQKGH